MKRRLKALSTLLFAAAALFALVFGGSLGDLLRGAVSLVDSAFPVPYRVEYTDASTAKSVSLAAAPVFFEGDIAVVATAGGALRLPVDSLTLHCADASARLKNVWRAGFLAIGACLAAAGLEIGLLTLAALLRQRARARQKTRRSSRAAGLPNAA
jgi:hypothetical protein